MDRLFSNFWQPLFQFSYNLLKDDDDAKDVVQEVFIRLWDRRFDLDIHTSLEAYLFSSVRYRSLTRLSQRLASDTQHVPLEEYVEQTFQEYVDPLILKELQEQIDVQIDQLPERMREVIRMNTKESLSIAEIANKLNISEDTVKNHLSSARKRLRMNLSNIAYTALLITLSQHVN